MQAVNKLEFVKAVAPSLIKMLSKVSLAKKEISNISGRLHLSSILNSASVLKPRRPKYSKTIVSKFPCPHGKPSAQIASKSIPNTIHSVANAAVPSISSPVRKSRPNLTQIDQRVDVHLISKDLEYLQIGYGEPVSSSSTRGAEGAK